jgi:hypothetical protein
MELKHQDCEVENNEDSITDDVHVVERNVTSLMTQFINKINDAKDIEIENDPNYERIIKRREMFTILDPATKKCVGRKGSSTANQLLMPSSRRKLKTPRKMDHSA